MLRDLFLLKPGITFLNHGSYGACPRPVFEVYQQWQRELEAQPVEFISRRAADLLHEARTRLAQYLHTSTQNLIFVTNATGGVNQVARSLRFEAGDEILGTNHEYGAIDNTWQLVCRKTGAVYVNQPMPLPFTTAADFVERFWQAVTPRTRVISISHITSPTAMTFPVAEICRRARQAGILTIIDAAHAPGQLELNLDELGADFYSGNCHKWMCAPKGAAFLYARPEVQELVEPVVMSWGYQYLNPPGYAPFVDWNEWQGTRDFSAWLSVPAAIDFLKTHNWASVRQECQQFIVETAKRYADLTGLPSLYPPHLSGKPDEPDQKESWNQQMVALRLPENTDLAKLKVNLWDKYQIEVPVYSWNNIPILRVSIQGYNTREDIDRLLTALKSEIENRKSKVENPPSLDFSDH